MKKRILSALLAGLMVFGCVGCGNNGASKDVTVIKFWTGSGSTKSTVEKIVDNYNNGQGKEKGIKVELSVLSNNQEAIDIAQQNGQLPDICGPTYVQAELFAKQGDLVPLESFEGGLEFFEKMNSPKREKRNMFDGKVYAPFTEVMTAGLIYNKDMFKAAGIVDENGEAKPPKTWDELREVAKKLTDKSKNVYGYSFPYKFSTYYTIECAYAPSLIPARELIDYDNLTVKESNFNEVFDLMMALRDDGSLFPGAESLDNDTSRAYFAEGKIGMMPGMSWDIGVLTTQFVSKCDWAVAPAPVKDVNKTYPAYSSTSGQYYLTKTAMEHPEEAFDFYKYYYSDEVQLLLCEETGSLLINEDLMKKAKNIDKHALEFRALYDANYDLTVYPSYTVEGENSADMYQRVWAGKMTGKEVEKQLAANKQAGLRKAVENGTIDVTPFKKK